MSNTSIAQHFSQYFQPVIANTAELKKEVYRIRYKVYCEELNYESTTKFPDGLETDIYDARSIHYLLKHRSTGVYAGCVRVVLPQKQNAITTFPLDKVFPEHFSVTQTCRTNCCEISRLAVISEFRRRPGEANSPEGMLFSPSNGNTMREQKRKFPVIALSLYWISISLALVHELDILAIMEPRLARHLRRFGITSNLIGDLVEYRGKRGLFLIQPTKLLPHLDTNIRELFDLIHTNVENQLCLKLAV